MMKFSIRLYPSLLQLLLLSSFLSEEGGAADNPFSLLRTNQNKNNNNNNQVGSVEKQPEREQRQRQARHEASDDHGDLDKSPPEVGPDVIEKEDKEKKMHFLSATLGSNMVLQRDREAVLWGHSTPGAQVSATLLSTTSSSSRSSGSSSSRQNDRILTKTTTTVEDNGLWRLKIPPQEASLTPQSIDISSDSGEQTTIDNILFGDVFLCGGQSNMAFALPRATNGTEEAKRGDNYPHIRVFTVGRETQSEKPLLDLQTVLQPWSVASESSLFRIADSNASQAFSAVCWFFGREIADGLDNEVPIGLINSNWGDTKIQAWQSKGMLHNSMIHPFMVGPMALTGFAWYQGESNIDDQAILPKYEYHLVHLVEEWRQGFANPDAFFGIIQISCICHHEEGVPELREAQMEGFKRLSGTKVGFATNADRGDGCATHPPAKQDCGARLGRSALAVQYGQSSIHWKSPMYKYAKVHAASSSGTVAISIHFQDVSPQGLYLIDTPFSVDPNRPTTKKQENFRCEDEKPDTCVGAKILLNNKDGSKWVDATIYVRDTSKIELIADMSGVNVNVESLLDVHNPILATSYGWGQVPLMTLYDKGTQLPVLPWKENVSPPNN